MHSKDEYHIPTLMANIFSRRHLVKCNNNNNNNVLHRVFKKYTVMILQVSTRLSCLDGVAIKALEVYLSSCISGNFIKSLTNENCKKKTKKVLCNRTCLLYIHGGQI